MIDKLGIFFSGVFLATFGFSALFFLKFWRDLHDRFFLLFSLACAMITCERVAILFVAPGDEARSWAYLFRLVAFGLIFAAILDKNRADKRF
jgi:hypothetical protein